ncbi:hypothetical protein BJV78DRAFT_1154978 [Lactifluus subvellereus]|nr:hypothetical protein BJV78DRAFT_1154978 [Lactifluus subvellereus]
MPQRKPRGRPSKVPRVKDLNLRSRTANAPDPADIVDKDDDYGPDWNPHRHGTSGDDESGVEVEEFTLVEGEGATDPTEHLPALDEEEDWMLAKKKKASSIPFQIQSDEGYCDNSSRMASAFQVIIRKLRKSALQNASPLLPSPHLAADAAAPTPEEEASSQVTRTVITLHPWGHRQPWNVCNRPNCEADHRAIVFDESLRKLSLAGTPGRSSSGCCVYGRNSMSLARSCDNSEENDPGRDGTAILSWSSYPGHYWLCGTGRLTDLVTGGTGYNPHAAQFRVIAIRTGALPTIESTNTLGYHGQNM